MVTKKYQRAGGELDISFPSCFYIGKEVDYKPNHFVHPFYDSEDIALGNINFKWYFIHCLLPFALQWCVWPTKLLQQILNNLSYIELDKITNSFHTNYSLSCHCRLQILSKNFAVWHLKVCLLRLSTLWNVQQPPTTTITFVFLNIKC